MNAQQLKNSILQMAIQGKLVPQDPNDEPASILIERIREEKEKLIKEKKIKKEKNPSFIFRGTDNITYEKVGNNEPISIEDELPFEIPNSWEWVRLGSIGEWKSGATPSRSMPKYYDGDIPWLKTGDLNDGYIKYIPEKISQLALEKTSVKLNPIGSVLIAMYGATIGKLGILTFPSTTNQACCACLPIAMSNKYLFYFLMSHKDKFIKRSEGGAQPNISKEKIISTLIPLPPLVEQERIVAKLEELLPLVERYGDKQKFLDKLKNDFPVLLKKSILQEAVQGRLVPQDPSDEPASVLLERIREEKQRLIKEGKIKKDKNESIIYRRDTSHYEKLNGIERCIDDEIPFEIPIEWSWTRLGTVMINRDAERIPLSMKTREGLEKIYDYYGASGVIDKVDRYLFSKPLLLIGEDGANLLTRSKPIAFIARGQYWVNNHAHVLDSLDGLLLEYVALCINAINLSPYVTGTAQPKMNQEKMNSIFIPIPPSAEQYRIVKRVEELQDIIKGL